MKILLASSEALPYSKTGGLADMVGALLRQIPCPRGRTSSRDWSLSPHTPECAIGFPTFVPFDWKFDLPFGPDRISGGVWIREADKGLTIYFIDQPAFFDRAGIYQERGIDYPDNAERYIFFSKCVAHLARYLPWQPEVVHAHDWPAALTSVFVEDQKLR